MTATAPGAGTRPGPAHGTRACYLRGCRRDECHAAHKRYCKEYDLRRHRHGPRNIDATAAAERLRRYIAEGWTHPALAEATSVPEHTISDLIYRPGHKTSAANVRRILAFRPAPGAQPDTYWIHPAGTIRRIKALAAIGHPVYSIAAAIGAGESTLRHIISGGRKHVSRDTAAAIAGLYAEWSRRPGPSPYTRGIAAARRWHGPLAWGADIDDPDATPDESQEPALPAHQLAALLADEVQHLARFGVPVEEIAHRVGRSESYVREQLKGRRGPGWRRSQAAEEAERAA